MNSQANAIEFRNRICMILQTFQSNKKLTKNVTATNVTKLNTKGVKAQCSDLKLVECLSGVSSNPVSINQMTIQKLQLMDNLIEDLYNVITTYTWFHHDWIQTSMYCTAHYLIQKHLHQTVKHTTLQPSLIILYLSCYTNFSTVKPVKTIPSGTEKPQKIEY